MSTASNGLPPGWADTTLGELASDGVTQHLQGTVTATGGGGDLEVQNTSFVAGQPISITSYSWTEGNG